MCNLGIQEYLDEQRSKVSLHKKLSQKKTCQHNIIDKVNKCTGDWVFVFFFCFVLFSLFFLSFYEPSSLSSALLWQIPSAQLHALVHRKPLARQPQLALEQDLQRQNTSSTQVLGIASFVESVGTSSPEESLFQP